MTKTTTGDRKWLEMHGGKWRVTLAVPAKLRDAVGATRLKQSLKTDSLAVANELKWGVIKDLKDRMRSIERSGGRAGAERTRVLREAANIATALQSLPHEERFDAAKDMIEQRVQEILGGPVGYETVRPLYAENGPRFEEKVEVEVYAPAKQQLADQFVSVAFHGRKPIANADAQYKKIRLKVSPRTEDDHDRALSKLSTFCLQKGYGDDVAAVDHLVVTAFISHLENSGELAARTIKKYVSRLNLYFAFLKSLSQIKDNPWRDAVVFMPTVKNSELERPFTESEIVTLLTGPAKPAMRDLMMMGALTGARVEAIVQLKVGDVIDGKAFRFKPMKREPGERFVPIHSSLKEVVGRRTKGRKPTDDFFPEYPVNLSDPRVERSFRASKHFTTYRRSVGVEDKVPGRRRSRVNFHSWRRWFITKGERTAPPEGMISALVGHARQGMTLGVYSEGPEMRAARRTVEKIKLPPLDGSPVMQPEAVTPKT